MHDPSSALNAAIRAMRGESDMDAVRPALGKRGLVCIIACAPDTHRIVRAVAALRDGLTALLDAPIIADHALHDAVERMIGTPEGRIVLDSWADIVPAGRGRAYAAALIDAVQKKQCASGVAAALIGPCNDSAALLRDTLDIAFAIRRWGQSTHDTPIAWTDALSPEERERLLDTIQRSPSDVARCLPWLPPDRANHMSLDTASLCLALDAFAKASPTVQALYTDLMLHLVAQAQSEHLRSITRLACATQADDVWARVQTLIWEHPEHAERVVYEAPWDDLPKMVRDIAAELNPIISAARGRRDATTLNASAKNASAFFAVLDPRVWDALDVATQTRWRQSLRRNAHLAVRSLGLRPEFLPHASLSNELIHAARRHTHDSSIVRWTLLPITLRLLPIAEAHDLIAALPTPPPDPSAFFGIATKINDPNVITSTSPPPSTPADLALAVVLQRCTNDDGTLIDRWSALQHALQGRTWDDVTSMMPILSDAARTVYALKTDVLARHLSHPDRIDRMRWAFNRLATFPPEVVVPIFMALRQWASWMPPKAAEGIVTALRDHGELFVSITDALANAYLRNALLPLPDDAAEADAIRALACNDPLSAHRIAHALHDCSWRVALRELLTAPPHHAVAIWKALNNVVRSEIGAVVTAAPLDADPLAVHDPIAVLALAAMESDDADLRDAGADALTMHIGLFRVLWNQLPRDVQQRLHTHFMLSDLPIVPARSADQTGFRRWRT